MASYHGTRLFCVKCGSCRYYAYDRLASDSTGNHTCSGSVSAAASGNMGKSTVTKSDCPVFQPKKASGGGSGGSRRGGGGGLDGYDIALGGAAMAARGVGGCSKLIGKFFLLFIFYIPFKWPFWTLPRFLKRKNKKFFYAYILLWVVLLVFSYIYGIIMYG